MPRASVLLASPPADPASAARALASVLDPEKVRVGPADRFVSASAGEQDRLNRLVFLILAGPASLFALIAIANVLVMALSRRGREIAGLRLIGARPWTVRLLILGEILLVTTVAVLVAAALIALALIVYREGLNGAYLRVPLTVPWRPLAGLTAGCLLVAAFTGLLGVNRLLRRPPADLARGSG